MIKHRGAKRRGRAQGALRAVGVVQVPDIGVDWHLWAHLLESENSVADRDSSLSILVRMPCDLGN